MRSVNIGELKNGLSGDLQHVREGEEIVVRDRNIPVARILPFRRGAKLDREAQLVATGAMKMPGKELDWNDFFLAPASNVSHEIATEVAVQSRGDR